MNEQQSQPTDFTQLTQSRVPLEDAGEVFTLRNEFGQIPIVIVPQRLNRIKNELVGMGVVILVGSIIASSLLNEFLIAPLGVVLGALFIVLGVYRSFMVRIPEGANALLMRGGRYIETIESGTKILPPWIIVSHLVTRREIPFDVPMVEVPTKDNVRANVDTLLTFKINDPYRFVYSISASDFDQVFQAICQDTLRLMLRKITAEEVVDLTQHDLSEVLETLNKDIESYGVEATKINITYAQPPAEFMHSLEMRQLALIQQEEQRRKQALAKQLQTDNEDLAHQEVVARVQREKELLQEQFQQAEARHQLIEMEANAEDYRLQKLQDRLEKYPQAVQFEVETRQLEIANSLASNSRAVLQMGSANDIVNTLMVRDMLKSASVETVTHDEESEE